MPKRRVTIAGLIGLVALAGLATAAISAATSAWAGFWYSLTFFLLLASLLGIGFGRGSRRVFWTGFAALGWGYMVLQYVPIFGHYLGPRMLAPAGSGPLFEAIHSDESSANFGMGGMGGGVQFDYMLIDRSPAGSGPEPIDPMSTHGGFRSVPVDPIALAATTSGGFPSPTNTGATPQKSPYAIPNFAAFQRIGTALEALIWATLGGWAARYFAARRGGLDPMPTVLVARPMPVDRGGGPPDPSESTTVGV